MSSPVPDPDAERDDRRRPTSDPERRDGPLRPLGVGTRNVIEGLLGLPMALADAAAYPVNRLYDALRPAPPLSGLITDQQRQPLFRPLGEGIEILDWLGLPRAETPQERIAGRVVGDLAGTANLYGLGRSLIRATGELIPLIGRTLITAPVAQATGATAAGLAGGVAREVAPDSAAADLAASLLGGALGGALPLVLTRGGAGGTTTAMARSAGHGQDTAAGVAARQAAQPEGTAAFIQPTAANDIAPLPRSGGEIAARASAEPPADVTTPRIATGEQSGSSASPQTPTASLAVPAVITASPAMGAQPMTAREGWGTLQRPSPPIIIEPVPNPRRPQAARNSQIILDSRAEEVATPRHQRPPLPDQPPALRQPMPDDMFDVPQIMSRTLDATRLSVLAPRLLGPHGRRLSGRGDLAVLDPYAPEVVRRLADSLDPVVVRLARGENVPGATRAQIMEARLGEHYNMLPILESMLEAGLSPQAATNRLQLLAALIAATSPVTNMRANHLSAGLFANRLGLGLPIDARAIAEAMTPGFNIMYSRHAPLAQRAVGGGLTLSQHSKLLAFLSALTGDRTAFPIDSNKVRYTNMTFNDVAPGILPRASFATERGYHRYLAAYRNGGPGMTDHELLEVLARAPGGQRINGVYVPSELPFYHDIITQAAERRGLSPLQGDSLLWFNFADRTGLASPRMTQVDILNERFARTAAALGITPREAAHMHWRQEIPIALVAGVAGTGAVAGLPGTQRDARGAEEIR